MDNGSPTTLAESDSTGTCLNGSSMRRPSPGPLSSPSGRPASLLDHNQGQAHVVRVVVNKDEKGYGMKVSGDNPVYVQSVKDGGAAEKAGLHAGDKIIKVNGVNVMQSTHTQVVALIKSSSQVVLTVQQRTSALRMGSPSLHNRPVTTPTSSRITGPQPVDNEKQYQLQLEKEQYYRLMIEKEQNYIDLLRSQIASSPDEKKYLELAKTEKNLQTLQAMLMRSQNEQQSPAALDSPPSLPKSSGFPSPNGNSDATSPPPLPKRNGPQHQHHHHHRHTNNLNGKTPHYHINERREINANTKTERKRRPTSEQPPPLPPRPATLSTPPNPPSASSATDPDAVNSINKQMSYPLVATCTPLVNDYSPNHPHHHHRTKSSPEQLLSMVDANGKKLSESMSDLTGGRGTWEGPETPPGTPPPPYPSPRAIRREGVGGHDEGDHVTDECFLESPELAGFRGMPRVVANSSPIHAATPSTTQQPIISMEDDDVSDQESNQLEDHGHFKSLARLWEHLPHLAVFMNYILSNSDPNSLMFYLLTDLYKEGNAKEMRKWAFEIHSCFLVPGAPLRLGNVDENIAREIDMVLTKEYDKEEILRKIFWKARSRAKEELTRQLVEFQHRRTAGLGTIFGPTDQILSDVYNDKTKEIKLYESLFLEKLEPYLEEVEKEHYDSRRYYTAAALATVLTRIFQMRPTLHALDRCPTFVNKEKSFRTKFIGKYSRKLNVLGHQFVAQQYYTVIMCNNCHQILYGIGPQGYQCSACLINLHRHCVKQFEDTCPGPIMKKDRGIMKLIGMRHDNTDHNRIRKSSQFLQMERERRQLEERDNSFDLNENDSKQSQPVSRSGSDRRPDSVREEGGSKHQDSSPGGPGGGGGGGNDAHGDAVAEKTEVASPESSTILPAVEKSRRGNSNINRSESVKEQSEKRKQRRNISDPSHNTTSVADLDRHPGLSNTDSGSSSNSSISCNGRLSESPSNSVDAVGQSGPVRTNLDSDSDLDAETDSWQHLVPLEEFKNLSVHEKKRQDVINEFFHTESSHVRNLKVLYKIFYKKIQDSQTLKPDELSLIFPNIKEMLDIHTEISKEMRRRRKEDPLVKEIGEMLMKVFEDRQGEALKKAAATFCERQQLALEFIKRRRERDSKFDSVLSECEKKRQCRRLPFQGILPTEMQRLSKYPLLLERLIGSIESGDKDESGERSQHQQEELTKLRRAHHMSKEILNCVNEAAKVAHNRHRLEEIQKHLDTSSFERSDLQIAQEFRTLDLTKYRLIIEGGMQLRRPNKGVVPVHILLLEEAVVILHREGDKFLLKFFQSGSLAQPLPLSPIIRMNTLLVRTNAVCKNALFLVNMSTNNSQMYDLMAEDEIKREVWFKHFSDATESYKRREGKSGVAQTPPEDDSDTESVQELPPPTEVTAGRAEAVGGKEENASRTASVEEAVEQEKDRNDDAVDEESREVPENGEEEEERETGGVARESTESPEMVAGGGNLVESSKVSAEEWPLIQPSQVNVAVPPVHTAESMLTPLEQIRRKDALVKQALEDKEGLVADMLSIPREHFQHIADMATVDTSTSREPSERVLASIFQVDQLQKAINRSLNISEKDVLVAKGGKHQTCASQTELTEEEELTVPLTIPVNLVRDVANSLSSQLTTLLSEVKQMEEERDRLRKELHNVRERLHEEHNLHSAAPTEDVEIDCALQVDASLNDSLQMVTKSDCEEEQ